MKQLPISQVVVSLDVNQVVFKCLGILMEIDVPQMGEAFIRYRVVHERRSDLDIQTTEKAQEQAAPRLQRG